jgi:Chaperone of endosialidase
MNPLTQSKNTTILPALIALTLGFGLSPQARAVCRQGCDLSTGSTFLGDDALLNNTGAANTAIGSGALMSNSVGYDNTATGVGALESNAIGHSNTANGAFALEFNTTGSDNTATGAGALAFNNGNFNVADGFFALFGNTRGGKNTATGAFALVNNTTGQRNTATGYSALFNMTTGGNNIALGDDAGSNLTTGFNNIDIGNLGVADESGTIRIGNAVDQTATFIAGISGATVPTGVAVIVDANGHLGTTTSSARFKEAIKPMDKASEAIHALKPVTFRYKPKLDPDGIPQFGLVAEDVENVNPALVARDDQGKPYTVRYEAVNAMLLNEFLKEHRKVESLEKAMAEQQKENAAMRAMLKEQAAQIQKVSAALEARESSPQIVLNNQ